MHPSKRKLSVVDVQLPKLLGLRRSWEILYCGVEQLVARWAHNPKVIGSSPVPATRKETLKGVFFVFVILDKEDKTKHERNANYFLKLTTEEISSTNMIHECWSHVRRGRLRCKSSLLKIAKVLISAPSF